MSEWTQIPADTFDIDRPILGSTHLAIVQNFLAMAEGAEDAPRIEGVALTGIFSGRGSASRGSQGTSNILTITDLDDASFLMVSAEASAGSTGVAAVTARVQFRTSVNNGASWGSFSTIVSSSAFDSPNISRSIVREIDLLPDTNAVQFRLEHIGASGGGNATEGQVSAFIIGGKT